MNIEQHLADLTDTSPEDWEEIDGPDYGVGQSYHFIHEKLGYEASVVIDEGSIYVDITDADGDPVT